MALLGNVYNAVLVTVVGPANRAGSLTLGANQIQLIRRVNAFELSQYPTASAAIVCFNSDENAVLQTLYVTQTPAAVATDADSCITLTSSDTGLSIYVGTAYVVQPKIYAVGSGASFQLQGSEGGIKNNINVTQTPAQIRTLLDAAGSSSLPSTVMKTDQDNTMAGGNDIRFRDANQYIESSAADTLDIGANTTMNLEIGGSAVAVVTAGGVTMQGTDSVAFGAATEAVSSSVGGQLDIDAATEVEITTTTVDINATTTDISGVVLHANGSVTDPSVSFAARTNQGMYSISATQLGFSNGAAGLNLVVDTTGVSTDNVKQRVNLGTTPVGTVSIVEHGDGKDITTVLTLNNFVVGALAGAAANLGVGNIVYAFPSEQHVELAYSFADLVLTAAGTAVNTDTGLGSVIASGAVAVLSGTATFEDRLTGQTIATDPLGGAAVSQLTTATAGALTGIALNQAGDVKNVFLNSAGAWNVDNVGNLTASGTIYLKWTVMS